MKYLSIFVLALLLTGCATVQVKEPNMVTEQIGQKPTIGQIGEAPVGGVLFSQFRYWSKVGFRVDDSLSMPFMLGRISMSPGDFLIRAQSQGKDVLCTEKRAYIDPLTGPHVSVCFEDVGDGKLYKASATPGMVTMSKDLTSPIRYSRSELITPRSDSFKYEILYQGISGKVLRLAYREYINDLARPAYFQDVSYDVESFPMSITFRTVRIEVLSANNNGVQYRVLSGF